MRLVRIPGNVYVDLDHIGMVTVKTVDDNTDYDQVIVRIILKDRTSLEPFYMHREEIVKFIEEYKIAELREAPAYEGRPE